MNHNLYHGLFLFVMFGAPYSSAGNEKKILQPVSLHGDQLFEERARNTKWTYQDGVNQYDKLEGLQPEAADWHAKVNLYEVNINWYMLTMSITPLPLNPPGLCKEGYVP